MMINKVNREREREGGKKVVVGGRVRGWRCGDEERGRGAGGGGSGWGGGGQESGGKGGH